MRLLKASRTLRGWVPSVNQVIDSNIEIVLKKLISVCGGDTSLLPKCLTKWVMTVNQVVVSPMQTREETRTWHPLKFTVFPSVTSLTGKNEVPDAIDIHEDAVLFKFPREKMIHVRQALQARYYGNCIMTIKAFPLLVSVQRWS